MDNPPTGDLTPEQQTALKTALQTAIDAAENGGGAFVTLPPAYVVASSRQLPDGRWEHLIMPVGELLKHAKYGTA